MGSNLLDTNHQSGGVNANNRVSVVAFEVTPQPGAGLAPIGIDNGGSVVYQSIPGATFTGIAPTTQEEIEPPTSNTPGIYRVTWESSSQSISNNGDFYRVKLTNGLSGETITSEIHYSDVLLSFLVFMMMNITKIYLHNFLKV